MQPHQLARASPITHSTLQLERLFLTVPPTCWELMSLSGRKQSTFVISYLLGLHLAESDTDCDALTGSRTPAPAALLGLMIFTLVPAALLFPTFIGVGTKTSLERLVSRFVYPVVWGCWSYSIFLPSDHTFSIWSVFRWKSSRYFNSSSITLHITNWSFPFIRRTIRNPEEWVAMKTASLWQCWHFVRWQIKEIAKKPSMRYYPNCLCFCPSCFLLFKLFFEDLCLGWKMMLKTQNGEGMVSNSKVTIGEKSGVVPLPWVLHCL